MWKTMVNKKENNELTLIVLTARFEIAAGQALVYEIIVSKLFSCCLLITMQNLVQQNKNGRDQRGNII
jgi:hypothetical protein